MFATLQLTACGASGSASTPVPTVYQETEDVNDDESSHDYIYADVHFYTFEDIETFSRRFEDDIIRYFTPMDEEEDEDVKAPRFDRQDKLK